MQSEKKVDKIDVEALIKDFKVLNVDTFATYLKEVWKVNIIITPGSFTKKRREE
jgi:hypothetical protein